MVDYSNKLFDGPIPGENYTTDTRNFPWHRPPQYTKLDEAIEACIQDLMDDEKAMQTLTLCQIGFDIVDVAQMKLMQGVQEGKWTFDFALLMAGPIAHVLVLMCRAEEIPFTLGVNKDGFVATKSLFDEISKLNPDATQGLSDLYGQDAFDPEPASSVDDSQETSPLGGPQDPGGEGTSPVTPEQAPEAPMGLGGF